MKNNKNDNNSSSNNKIEYLHIIVGFRITPAAKVVVTISSLWMKFCINHLDETSLTVLSRSTISFSVFGSKIQTI